MSHPLHPALVHFPIACWSLATAADVASLWFGEPAWRLAGVLLALGTLIALAAMATGFMELLKVGAEHPATRDLNRHLLLMLVAYRHHAVITSSMCRLRSRVAGCSASIFTSSRKPVTIAASAASVPTTSNTPASRHAGSPHHKLARSAAVASDQHATGKCTSAGCSGWPMAMPALNPRA